MYIDYIHIFIGICKIEIISSMKMQTHSFNIINDRKLSRK
jgi:hypothetical protein